MQRGQFSLSVKGAFQRLGNPVVSVSKIKYIKTKLTNNLRAEERSYWQLLTIAQFRFEIKNIHCFSQIDYTVTRKFKNKYRVDTVRAFGAFTGLHILSPKEGDQVYVTTGKEVMEIEGI